MIPVTHRKWATDEPKAVPQAIEYASDKQMAPLGTIVRAHHPEYGEGEFIYVKGVTDGAQHDWVTYNLDDGSVARTGANAIGPVGILMAALGSATTFGWAQISGKAVGKAAAGFADNGNVYLTSTAGTVDDAVVAGDYVYGAKGASAIDTPDTGLAEFELSRPFVKDGLDDAS